MKIFIANIFWYHADAIQNTTQADYIVDAIEIIEFYTRL